MAASSPIGQDYENGTWRVGCSGKIPFFSEALARDTLRRWYKSPKGKLKVYQCFKGEFGKHWHLTSKGKTWKK